MMKFLHKVREYWTKKDAQPSQKSYNFNHEIKVKNASNKYVYSRTVNGTVVDGRRSRTIPRTGRGGG